MTYLDTLLMRALTATDDKIRVCHNPYTGRWLTIQHQLIIASTKDHPPALAVARAQAFKLPRARDTNRAKHDVVEEVGCGSHAPRCSSGDGDGGFRRPPA